MKKRQILIIYKVIFSVLVLAAITTQLYHGLQKDSFSVVNFFSFFTIESNLFGVVTFLMAAGLLIQNKKRNHEQEMLCGAATLYMVTTGIIYAVLLSRADVQTPLPWVNATLHYIFPLIMLADWLYDRQTHKITVKQSLLWLGFPLAYVAYALVRGPLAHHWYPYPFLNVGEHGYLVVLINSVLIGLVVAGLAQVIRLLPQKIKRG